MTKRAVKYYEEKGLLSVDKDNLVLISVGFLHPDTTTLVDQLPVDLDM